MDYVNIFYEKIIPGGKSMKKLIVKEIRRLGGGRVELKFYGVKGKRIDPIKTKDRGYKKGDEVDPRSLRIL